MLFLGCKCLVNAVAVTEDEGEDGDGYLGIGVVSVNVIGLLIVLAHLV